MQHNNTLTAERLRELLEYDPDTGIFTWRVSRRGLRAGAVAGRSEVAGYVQIGIAGKHYKAHRLAWLYVYGNHPTECIDHRNGIRDDNRIANLREATNAENSRHQTRLHPRNTSGYRGVTWDKEKKKWKAHVEFNGSQKHLGYFADIHEAARAADAARREHYGDYAGKLNFQPSANLQPELALVV